MYAGSGFELILGCWQGDGRARYAVPRLPVEKNRDVAPHHPGWCLVGLDFYAQKVHTNALLITYAPGVSTVWWN